MKNIVMLVISLLVGMAGSVLRKIFTKKNDKGAAGGFLFNAVCSLLAAVILFCFGGIGSFSVYTLLLGALFGVLTAVQGIAALLAFESGPLSYSSVIISFSMIIPSLSGAILYGESIAWAHCIGIGLMLVSFVLAVEKKRDEKKANFRWLLFCMIAFLATGGIGVMQKIHQSSEHKQELDLFLVVALSVSALLCGVVALILWKRRRSTEKPQEEMNEEEKPAQTQGKKKVLLLLLLMALSGIGVAVNNKFNLYLSGVMNSAVYFPVVNGGGLVLTTVSAFIIFRERFSVKQWIGIALGIVAVVFLCNPLS